MNTQPVRILGIESSCDETSAAIVEDGSRVRSLVIASQTEIHARHHGVVPELASRAHVEQIQPVVSTALKQAGIAIERSGRSLPIDGIAVTNRPGLSGSLAVGLSFAKGLAFAAGIPLIAVDHICAHAYAVQLVSPLAYPYLVLLVSGGHTLLAISRSPRELDVLGTTIDDACGEAFDKVSAYLGSGYPGGPAIDRLARDGEAEAYRFPQPKLKRGTRRFDFSYSGLKTAVVHQRDAFHRSGYAKTKENVAASFQRAAVDQLIDRVGKALDETHLTAITIGGGVAANSELRRRIAELARTRAITYVPPPPELCVDNGAMVAGLGYALLRSGERSALDIGVNARVREFRARAENPRQER